MELNNINELNDEHEKVEPTAEELEAIQRMRDFRHVLSYITTGIVLLATILLALGKS